jgi:hypothetical protein
MGNGLAGRIRDLVTQMAATGLSANEIGSARISIIARSTSSTRRPDTLAQDQPRHRQKPLATHGRSIHLGQELT